MQDSRDQSDSHPKESEDFSRSREKTPAVRTPETLQEKSKVTQKPSELSGDANEDQSRNGKAAEAKPTESFTRPMETSRSPGVKIEFSPKHNLLMSHDHLEETLHRQTAS